MSMKKIWEWLISWPKDKVLHFALSMIVALVAAVVAHVCGAEKYTVLAVGWFAGFFAGFGKEIYDEVHSGSSDSTDWAADLLGTTVGCLIALLLVS